MDIINAIQATTDVPAIAKRITNELNDKELWGAWRMLVKLVKKQRTLSTHPIALARRAKGLTLAQLSEQTGFSRAQIRNAEHGGNVNVRLAIQLSEILGVPLVELFQEPSEEQEVRSDA